MDKSETILGFAVRLHPSPGLSPQTCERFLQRYDNYLAEQELQFQGTQLWRFVFSPDRSLSVTDQVNLLSWLMADEISPNVQLGALQSSESQDWESGGSNGVGVGVVAGLRLSPMVWAWQSDPVLWALLLLYRWGRIGAVALLDILEGRPAGLKSRGEGV
jgi:hypothetical protein